MPENVPAPVPARPERTSTLILDCTACVDPAKAGEPWRQMDGLREWVADFIDGEIVNEADGFCPECGSVGRVWSY